MSSLKGILRRSFMLVLLMSALLVSCIATVDALSVATSVHAALFAFETLRQVYVPETQAAVKALNAGGDSNVYFVTTTGWLTAGDYSADGGHPNDQGQIKIAAKLTPIIANVIG